jgi:ABC-2 type transport system permease protein
MTATAPVRASRGPTRALLALFVRTQATRGRVLVLAVLGAVFVVVAISVASGDTTDPAQTATDYVNGVGLSLLVPVTALVFASASFGDLREDETLVYLWLRPVRASRVVAAAAVASVAVVLPLTVVPLVASAAIISAEAASAVATAVAVTVAAVAYVAIFTLLGLVVNRPLVWGLAYVLLWEGFVAEAGKSASRVAVRAYTRSLLADLSDTQLDLGTVSMPWAWLVPVGIAAAGLGIAVRRFTRQEVA